MSSKHNDAWYETTFEKHLEEQCKKYKDYAQAELEAMVLTMKELEEYD